MHPLAPPGETGRGLCVRRISRWRARRRAKVIWAARRADVAHGELDRRRLGRPTLQPLSSRSRCRRASAGRSFCSPRIAAHWNVKDYEGAWSSAKTRARWCLCSRARRWSRPSSVARLRYVSRHALPAPARLSACPGCPTPPTRRRGAGIGCAARIVSTSRSNASGPPSCNHSWPSSPDHEPALIHSHSASMPVSRAAPQPMSARTSNPRAGLKAAPGAASGFVRVRRLVRPKTRHGGAVAPPGAAIPAAFRRALRDHAHTRLGVHIIDSYVPPGHPRPYLSIECAPCGRAGRYCATWQSSWRNKRRDARSASSDAVPVAPCGGKALGEIDIGRLVWPKKRRHSSPLRPRACVSCVKNSSFHVFLP